MELPNWVLRAFVRITRFKPKVFSDEEKAQKIAELIEQNRRQDRDITTCSKELIEGLAIESVPLPNAGAWIVKQQGNPSNKIVYYIHGGGFVGACTKERMPFVSTLTKRFGYNVFSLDYRLAPEWKQPCQLSDCLDGYLWLLDRYAPKNIVLIGESAGGNLVLSLSMLLRDKQLPLPKAVYSNSPVTQFSEYTDSFRMCSLKTDFIVTESILENTEGIYFDRRDALNPYVSPLYGDVSGLPPILLTASQCECLLDDAVHMYEKLKAAGGAAKLITYPKLCHAFIISPQMKKVVRDAYPDLDQWLHENLGKAVKE